MDALDEAAAKGKHTGTTYRMDNPGGTTWFELSASTLKAPPDGAEHFIVITRDVTERKQAKQSLKEYADRLAHSNVQLERFAFVASHHLQEPLRTVISHLQLLESRYKDQLDDQAQTHIEYPVKAALHMRTLIRDLLNFSATESGRSVFTLTDCEVIVKQALEALQDIIEEKKGEVTHDPLPKVMADKVQLTQLFQNLIANAIKFHREDEAPRVHISASRSENAKAWRFSIRDNGIGIAPAYHERVFEIFERLHTREEYPGTGIGLAICRKIVERHGGRIWVRSEPGKGSTFHFTIPAEEDTR
jgi:light-regulated signal transduction histidine kinase (bacteriophytochrome)